MTRTLAATLAGLLAPLFLIVPGGTRAQQLEAEKVVEDFEAYEVGGSPTAWNVIKDGRELVPVPPVPRSADEYFEVREEDGNKYAHAYTKGEATTLILVNGEGFTWDLKYRPVLRWAWRATALPEGAREDEKDLNDTGAAVYVTFSQDWLGRPRSIKYTYSSTLPVGTVVSQGRLKALVVASGESGEWTSVMRNVAEDYRRLFGKEPPDEPISIALWSDSDNTGGPAEADFDDLTLLPASAKTE